MDNGIHFISGLPRSGSTLLSAILRQNPRFHAGMTSPVGTFCVALLGTMGARGEWSDMIDEEQREAVLRALFDGYYNKIHSTKLVFDTNRLWCAKMDAIARLFPQSRVIVCVRDMAWIMDSFELLVRKNPFLMSRMYGPDTMLNVFARTNSLGSSAGVVGSAWESVQEAFYGNHSHRLLVVDYEALAREPQRAMEFIYNGLGLPPFMHDFDNVTYEDGGEFDARLGIPGLHRITGKVKFEDRPSVLPPDVFKRFSGRSFWRNPKANPRHVQILLPAAIGSVTKVVRSVTSAPQATA
jgi:sulfotransferase